MTAETTVEVTAETIEAAIEIGLEQLGVAREDVNVEVVEEARKGFLGLGNREAIVRLTVRPDARQNENQDLMNETDANLPMTESTSAVGTEEQDNTTEESSAVQTESKDTTMIIDDEFDDLDALPDPELLEEAESAGEVIRTLLEKMYIEADVTTELSEKDDLDRQIVLVNINGGELADLIGRSGETLVTFQYMSRLMVSQQLQRRVDFLVDVNGYRQQREEGLMRLADRMAEKVLRRSRPVTLEPMSPFERRLIHVRLRERDDVFTKSIGSGNQRRVRIYPDGWTVEEYEETNNRNNRRRRRRY